MDISPLIVHANKSKRKKIMERSKESKRARIGDGDFSPSRSVYEVVLNSGKGFFCVFLYGLCVFMYCLGTP